MSNNKQTALDWYMEAMNQDFDEGGIHCGLYKDNKIYEQAKARHKQEICQTYIDAMKECMINPLGDAMYQMGAEEYYNEKFGEPDVERMRYDGDKIMIMTSSGNVGIGSSARRRGDNNIPDTDNNTTGENNNTSTTGNISDNIWGGDTSSTTGNSSTTWGGYRLNVTGTKEDDDRIKAEKQIWDRTVNWDIRNKYTRVADEEQAPYNVKTEVNTVSKPNKTDDGTLAVIEITVKVKQP
jgi:hypothetical protein